jgi:DNA-binding MarR family transcriptional regulator
VSADHASAPDARPASDPGADRRAALLEQVMHEARRGGSIGTLHNRAAADLVGMNQTDWDCLDVLDWTGPITAGELAKRVGLTSGAITGVLDRLEKSGLARRVADPRDRRRVIVEMTVDPTSTPADERQAALQDSFGQLAAEMFDVSGEFDAEQLEAILHWLQAGNAAVERSIARMRDRARG